VPSFTLGLADLQATGPVVDVQLAVGSPLEAVLLEGGEPVPGPVRATAMIDTGATGTVIQEGIAAQLDLNPVGVAYINTPSSTNVACQTYHLRLAFPNDVVVEGVFIEAPLRGQHIQCLIGRDILAHCVFIYNGHANQFTLSI
jgi:predicted aspartyl protease